MLALDTLVPNPTGWTTVGDLQAGDCVLVPSGQSILVCTASQVVQNEHCLRFTFAGGASVVCSTNHLWTLDARKRRSGKFSAEYIARTWQEGRIKRNVYRAATAAPLSLSDAALELHPYVLGAWLGDGLSCAEAGFICHQNDDQVLQNIAACGHDVKRHDHIRCAVRGLRAPLWRMGLAENKHIPVKYLRASHEQRMALLRGLMDTDGTVWIHKGSASAVCSYCTKLPHLANQVVELLATLGIKSRVSVADAIFNGRNYGPAYRIEFYPGEMPVFALDRKQVRLAGQVRAERHSWRALVRVEQVPSAPVRCITVENEDRLFLITHHMVPT